MVNVTLPFDGDFESLRVKLAALGFTLGTRPNAPVFAQGPGVSLHAYRTGKILLTGVRAEEWATTLATGSMAKGPAAAAAHGLPQNVTSGIRAGIDEAGKGDYFGPLVVAGVIVDDALATRLRAEGVRDSKELADPEILALASRLQEEILPANAWRVVTLEPERYNEFHATTRNLNKILGWAHARVIEDLVEADPRCRVALSDQFGNPRYIQDELMTRGRSIDLVQLPRAEREISVAAASILARARFVLEMRMMSARYDFRFPLGATHVEAPGRAFVQRDGADALGKVAKMHFVTTQRILGGAGRRPGTGPRR